MGLPAAGTPVTFQWDTTKLSDGSHTVAVTVKDGANRTATSAVLHETVDNTAPSATMYQPTPNARISGATLFQVAASDAYGVKSVRFTVDSVPVGTLLTTSDPGKPYVYSLTYDTSSLVAGAHAVSAVVIDQAGNTTTAPPVTIKTGPIEYLPVLNYHSIAPPDGYSIYDQTPAEADQQLAYLKANGYQAVTLEQYQQWLSGANIGVAKPVLITVDDGLNDEKAWDSLLQRYGMKAVMFVVTGYADNTTPGDTDPNNMTWATINQLATNGRWQVSFHAGGYGHGDSYVIRSRDHPQLHADPDPPGGLPVLLLVPRDGQDDHPRDRQAKTDDHDGAGDTRDAEDARDGRGECGSRRAEAEGAER